MHRAAAGVDVEPVRRNGGNDRFHTEFLQEAFGVKDVTMLMISERLKVGVVTGHIPLKDVPGAITEEKILSKLRLMKASLEQDFGHA